MQDHSQLPASASKTESLSTTSVAIVGASGSRHGLILCPPSSGTATLMTDSAVTIQQGFQISAGDPPLVLCRCQYGDMVTRPWFAISNEGQGPLDRSASSYWQVQERNIGGTPSITLAGVSGFRHVVTSITGSYGILLTTPHILTVESGVAEIWRIHLNYGGGKIWNDPVGIICDEGDSCTIRLTLVASTEGIVAASGVTIPSPTITYYELGEIHGNGAASGGNRPPQY